MAERTTATRPPRPTAGRAPTHRAERRAGVTPTEKAVDEARMACIFVGRLRGGRWSLVGGDLTRKRSRGLGTPSAICSPSDRSRAIDRRRVDLIDQASVVVDRDERRPSWSRIRRLSGRAFERKCYGPLEDCLMITGHRRKVTVLSRKVSMHGCRWHPWELQFRG